MNATVNVTLPADRKADAGKQLQKLQRLAAACGASFGWTWGEEHHVPHPTPSLRALGVRQAVTDLCVEGELAPVIEGHVLVGTLDHASVPGENLVREAPGESVPAAFWNEPAHCDHCETRRRRNLTVVMRREADGESIRLGRACCKHYFGHDIASALKWLGALRAVASWGDPEEGEFGRSAAPEWPAQNVLTAAAAVIRVHGFVSRAVAEERGLPATAAQVARLLDPPRFFGKCAEEQERQEAAWRATVAPTDTDVAAGLAARAWLATQPGTSSYFHNLRAIDKAEFLALPLFGYWTSLVGVHQRALRKAEDAAAQNDAQRDEHRDEHIGEEGKRLELEVEVERVTPREGDFGLTHIVSMRDAAGRALVWFASGSVEGFEPGKPLRIRATVKRHGQFNGLASTTVNRASLVAPC